MKHFQLSQLLNAGVTNMEVESDSANKLCNYYQSAASHQRPGSLISVAVIKIRISSCFGSFQLIKAVDDIPLL